MRHACLYVFDLRLKQGRGSGERPRGASTRGGLLSPGRGLVHHGGARIGHGNGSRNHSDSVSVGGGGGGGGGGSSKSRGLVHNGWAQRQKRYASSPSFSGGLKGGDGEARQEEEGDQEREFSRWRTPTYYRQEPLRAGSRGDDDGGGKDWGGGGNRSGSEKEEAEERQEEENPGSASSGKRPRARGRTLWETPRGVGLTPKGSSGSTGSPLLTGCRDIDGEEWGGRRGGDPYAAIINGASYAQRPRARGQTLWQTPRGVGLTPKVGGTRTREAQLSVRCFDRGGDVDGVEGGQEGQQESGHVGGASSVKRPRAGGQTLWQTPEVVGLTPMKAGARTERVPPPTRFDGDGGGGESGGEEHQGEGHLGKASSVKRPRARGQTMWQTPRGVGLTPKVAGVRTGTLYADHDGEDDGDGMGGGRDNQQGEEELGSSFAFDRPRARGQTLWQTPRGLGLTPRKTSARSGASPLLVRYHDDVEECSSEDQQEGEHTGTASSGRRSRARGQTLWQTPRGVGLTPKVKGTRTEERPSVRHRGDGGGECGMEQWREQEQRDSALSAERPRVGGQTLWQTPRGVGLSPKMTGARTGVPFADHAGDGGNEDGVGAGGEEQQGEKGSSGACSLERPRDRGPTLWQTPRGVGLSPKMAGTRTRIPLADRYHDNDGGGGREYGKEEHQQEEHPGNAPSVQGARGRGQTM